MGMSDNRKSITGMKNLFQKNALFRSYVVSNIAAMGGVLFMGTLLLSQKVGIIPNMQCVLLSVCHVYCPGCGGTRAFFSFIRGHFWTSFLYNPAVVLGAALILYYEVRVGYILWRDREQARYKGSLIPVYVYIGIVLLYATVRDVLLVKYGIDLLGNVL